MNRGASLIPTLVIVLLMYVLVWCVLTLIFKR